LRFEVDVIQMRGKVVRISGVAKVDGQVVCEAEMAAMVRDR
jgi:UDP-3-O-[3-hydroxymyristoyl] N-acetylglucosamine deacetylase/3-hydroxyacyl-[acyl-carrier-protein] dehydratase